MKIASKFSGNFALLKIIEMEHKTGLDFSFLTEFSLESMNMPIVLYSVAFDNSKIAESSKHFKEFRQSPERILHTIL